MNFFKMLPPKRPSPRATFARWRAAAKEPRIVARIGDAGGYLVPLSDAAAYARRAWNAGRRAARKERN